MRYGTLREKFDRNAYIDKISIKQVAKRNSDNYGHFFDYGATSFSNSVYGDWVYYLKGSDWGYFVTSERCPFNANQTRKSTIRQVCISKGKPITTVGKFQQYDTEKEAYAEMLEILLNDRLIWQNGFRIKRNDMYKGLNEY